MALPQYQYPSNALLDFSGLNAGIDAVGKRWKDDAKREKYLNALSGAGDIVDPRLVGVMQGMEPDQGANALFGAYNAAEGRKMTQAQMAETRRMHDQTLALQRLTEQRQTAMMEPDIALKRIQAENAQIENAAGKRMLGGDQSAAAPQMATPATQPPPNPTTGPQIGYDARTKVFNVMDAATGQWKPLPGAQSVAEAEKMAATSQPAMAPAAPQAAPSRTVPVMVQIGAEMRTLESAKAMAAYYALKKNEPAVKLITDAIENATSGGMSKEERKAADKETGEARGKALAALPGVVDNANQALDVIDQIRQHPGRSWGLGATSATGMIPGTDMRGFANLVDQAKGKAFLEAYQALRGSGAISEVEGKTATAAIARLDRAQNQRDFDAALTDFEKVVRKGLETARARAGKDPLAGPSPAAPAGPVRVRTPDEARKLPSGTKIILPDGSPGEVP